MHEALAAWLPTFGTGIACGVASVLVVHFGAWPMRLVFQFVRGLVN